MTDEKELTKEAIEEQETEVENTEETEEESSTAESEKTEHMIPKSRFDEVNSRLRALEKEQKEKDRERREAEERRLRDQDQYKELATKQDEELARLRPIAERYDESQQALERILAAEIAALPESKKKLVPKSLSPVEQLDWLAENKDELVKQTAPETGAGKRGTENIKAAELTNEEKEVARRFGMNPEEYAKFKQNVTPEAK